MVIAIGRQFGSGGREIGLRLAKKLGIGYYDKELLLEAAKRAGVAPEFFEERDEKFPSVLSGVFTFALGCTPHCYYTGASAISDDGLYQSIGDFLHQRAEQESFVVVGRSADYILRNRHDLVSVFVHAPMDECVKRILAREAELGNRDVTPKSARQLAEKTNKLRAEYYNFYTDHTWGDAATYDMTINSALLPMDDIVDLIADFVAKKRKVWEQE